MNQEDDPSYWRNVYGDGDAKTVRERASKKKHLHGAIIKKQEEWQLSSSSRTKKIYSWHGRKVTIDLRPHGSGLRAVRSLHGAAPDAAAAQATQEDLSSVVPSPLKIEVGVADSSEEPLTTVSAVSDTDKASSTAPKGAPYSPSPSGALSPIRTAMEVCEVDCGASATPPRDRSGIIYVNRSIRLKLEPNTAAVELQPGPDGIMEVRPILKEPEQPPPPSSPLAVREDEKKLPDESTPAPQEHKNMWKNQSKLPRLPLPSLESTVTLFLEVAETIVDEETFERTKAAATSFLTVEGPGLQEKLKLIDDGNQDSSWFASFHEDMYLNARYPGFVHKNPAGVFKDDIFEKCDIHGQVDRASHIICATLVFANQVINETLEPDVFKGFPIDMLQ